MNKESKFYLFINQYLFNSLVFKILMIAFTILTAIPYVHAIIGSYVKYGLALGILVCAWTVFNGSFKRILNNKLNWPLFAFASSYLITIVLHRDSYFIENMSQLIYMVVFFYLFCGLDSIRDKETVWKEYKIISIVFVCISFVYSVISFLTFVFEYSYWYQIDGSATWYVIGMYDNRLWGLYNSNTCGAISALSIIISYGLFQISKKKVVKVFFLINIVIQFLCLVLSYSRGSIISLFFVLSISTFAVICKRLEGRKNKVFISVFLTILVSLTMFGAEKITRSCLEYLPGMVNKTIEGEAVIQPVNLAFNNPYNVNFLDIEKVDLDRTDLENKTDVTTGRVDLWDAGIKTFREHPVLGISFEYATDYSSKFLVENSTRVEALKNGGFHSLYVSVLVSSGLIGFLLFVLFFGTNVFDIVKNRKLLIEDFYQFFPIIVVVFMLISELIEVRVLYRVGIFNVLFWISVGCIQNKYFSGYVKEK